MAGTRLTLVTRVGGLLCMALYALAAVASATDRQAATKPLWERVVPAAFADDAWRIRALLALRRNDAPASLLAARQAIRSGPMDQGSSELLGSALLLANQPAAADRAFRVAGQMGWRRPATQVYWMNQAMAEGDYRVAAMRLDALLRQTPQLAGDPTVMQPFESSPQGRNALLAKLSTRPPWMADYARTFEALPVGQLVARAEVLQALAASDHPLTCRQTGGIVSKLLTSGDAGRADSLWRASCPAQSLWSGDGNFAGVDLSRRDSLFSWWAPGDSDVSASIDDGTGAAEPRLVVASSSPFVREVVMRMIYLPAGTYRLQWRALTAAGKGSDRIAAVLSCRQGSDAPLQATFDAQTGRTTAMAGVGDECPARWLSFRISPGPAELHFGNVHIDRVH